MLLKSRMTLGQILETCEKPRVKVTYTTGILGSSRIEIIDATSCSGGTLRAWTSTVWDTSPSFTSITRLRPLSEMTTADVGVWVLIPAIQFCLQGIGQFETGLEGLAYISLSASAKWGWFVIIGLSSWCAQANLRLPHRMVLKWRYWCSQLRHHRHRYRILR